MKDFFSDTVLAAVLSAGFVVAVLLLHHFNILMPR